MCYFLHTHINQAVTFQLASLTRGREMVCVSHMAVWSLCPLFSSGNLFMSSFVCAKECITEQKWVFTLSIDVMCVCVSYFYSNHTADHMLEISMFCFLLESVWHFSLSVSHSPDDIGTCWYILLSGSVFIKESMFLPRSRYVPYLNAIKYQTFTLRNQKTHSEYPFN